jgi:hypothetical protein
MWFRLCGGATFLLTSILVLSCSAWLIADDDGSAHQLSLADLVKYHAALSGKVTVNDARASHTAVQVVFQDLWNRPEAFRGRRVIVEGRVQRIFRQGPIGDFPALAEIWIASPASNPFCLVVPQESVPARRSVNDQSLDPAKTSQQMPKLGQLVRFTGTFLKVVRFSAGDGARLAPLVVGDQPPVPVRDVTAANGSRSFSANDPGSWWAKSRGSWWLLGLTLALVAAGALARRHLRLQAHQTEIRNRHRKASAVLGGDPPLEFVEPYNKT